MRVYLDTNVLVSAFAARGLCADLFEVILLEHELVAGGAVLAELRRTLRTKLGLPVARCNDIVEYLQDAAAIRVGPSAPVSARVDADDAAILGEALGGHCGSLRDGRRCRAATARARTDEDHVAAPVLDLPAFRHPGAGE